MTGVRDLDTVNNAKVLTEEDISTTRSQNNTNFDDMERELEFSRRRTKTSRNEDMDSGFTELKRPRMNVGNKHHEIDNRNQFSKVDALNMASSNATFNHNSDFGLINESSNHNSSETRDNSLTKWIQELVHTNKQLLELQAQVVTSNERLIASNERVVASNQFLVETIVNCFKNSVESTLTPARRSDSNTYFLQQRKNTHSGSVSEEEAVLELSPRDVYLGNEENTSHETHTADLDIRHTVSSNPAGEISRFSASGKSFAEAAVAARKGKITIFVGDIMSSVYSRQYLVTHCLLGSKTKAAMDPSDIAEIEQCVRKYFASQCVCGLAKIAGPFSQCSCFTSEVVKGIKTRFHNARS